MVAVFVILVSLLDGAHESYKLSWNNPVQVSVLYSFIELILFYIKCAEIVPAESYGVFKTL